MFIRLLFTVFLLTPATSANDLAIVPRPTECTVQDGESMTLPALLEVSVPDDAAWREHIEIAGVHLERMTNGQHRLALSNEAESALLIKQDPSLGVEAYTIEISSKQITLAASSLKGLAHGTSTILQIIGGSETGTIPPTSINDHPRLSYRSLMIDMGRNPHSLQLLKETIDLLWFYKVDSVHLHLTDDQRIAFPSTAFPKLWDGIITAEEFKELEAYAVARGVTLIPELEVPGHSTLLLRHYPEVFGKSGTELASSETALEGIKLLLDEMTEIFSSTPYVHIGGDEAYGVSEELQRDLINKLHAHLKSKGQQTLVWEGPRAGTGDNKVNPEVIHLNWRTINYPADQMLSDGYRVVNAAWDPLYIVDHYPRTNFTMASPQHIFETLSPTRFKHFNPGMPTFAKPIEVEPSDQLIGFCMPWWEGREENYFPQIVPRLIPFAEVAWNPADLRDFPVFSARAKVTEEARQAAFYPVTIEATDLAIPGDGVFHRSTTISLKTKRPGAFSTAPDLRFTVDGSEPNATSTLYEQPITVSESTQFRAAAFLGDKQVGHGSRRNFKAVEPEANLALGKTVTSSVSSGTPFSVQRLTDGGTDNLDFYLGYPAQPEPIAVTIDLESVQSVSRITVHAYTISGSFEKYSVEVSVDGNRFVEVASRLDKPEQPTSSVEHRFDSRDVRFVRILSYGNLGYVFDSFSKLVEIQVHQ